MSELNNALVRIEELEKEIANLETQTNDTGWLDLPLANGISVGSISGKAQYRKIGKIVYLRGDVTGINQAGTIIATLPTGFRPSTQNFFIKATSGQRFTRIYIANSGNIGLEWTSDNTYNYNWYDINCSFMID